jgi:hypothetical protein
MQRVAHRSIAVVLVLLTVIVLAGCSGSSKSYRFSPDWMGPQYVGVAWDGKSFVLYGVSTNPLRVKPLGIFSAKVDENVLPSAVVLNRQPDAALAVAIGSGAGSQFFRVDLQTRSVDPVGGIEQLIFPSLIGRKLRGLSSGDTASGTQNRSFDWPSLRSGPATPVSVRPTASDGDCVVGEVRASGTNHTVLLNLAESAAGGRSVAVGVIPGGVSCRPGIAVITLESRGSALLSDDQPAAPAPDNRIAVVTTSTRYLTVGRDPRLVRLLDDSTVAVDVRDAVNPRWRAIQLVDIGTGAVTRTIPLPDVSQLDALVGGRDGLLVVSDDRALAVNPDSGQTSAADLPAPNITQVVR